VVTFTVFASLSYVFRDSAVQRQYAIHVPEYIFDRVQELSVIGLEEVVYGTDPERVDPHQLTRLDNHTTVAERVVNLEGPGFWICG